MHFLVDLLTIVKEIFNMDKITVQLKSNIEQLLAVKTNTGTHIDSSIEMNGTGANF